MKTLLQLMISCFCAQWCVGTQVLNESSSTKKEYQDGGTDFPVTSLLQKIAATTEPHSSNPDKLTERISSDPDPHWLEFQRTLSSALVKEEFMVTSSISDPESFLAHTTSISKRSSLVVVRERNNLSNTPSSSIPGPESLQEQTPTTTALPTSEAKEKHISSSKPSPLMNGPETTLDLIPSNTDLPVSHKSSSSTQSSIPGPEFLFERPPSNTEVQVSEAREQHISFNGSSSSETGSEPLPKQTSATIEFSEEGEVMDNCSKFLLGCTCHNYTILTGIVCKNRSDLSQLSRNASAYFEIPSDPTFTLEISLVGCAGEWVPRGVLEDLIVFRLTIDDPLTKGFAEGALGEVKRIRRIHVRRSAIETLPDFRPVSERLTHLWLEKSRLRAVEGDGVRDLPSLISLSFASNSIAHVQPQVFQGTEKVELFDVSWNSLEWLPRDLFDQWPALRKVVLSHNRLVHLDGLFERTHPRFIYADFNNLTDIDLILHPNMSNVETLLLSNNPLGRTSSFNDKVPSLRFLFLDHCGIRLFDVQYFAFLEQLATLDLSHNEIEVVQEQEIAFGTSLDLDLSGNKISEFRASISYVVKRLYLRDNRLEFLGETLQRTQLEEISVAENRIQRLTGTDFKHAHGVQVLLLNDNRIMSMERNTFERLRNDLQHLDLSRNRLEALDGSLRLLSQLKRLDLATNRLQKLIPSDFAGQNELSELYLQGNRIHVVGHMTDDVGVTSLPQLRLLHLGYNRVGTLKPSNLPAAIRYVYLAGNPLKCDCKLLPLLTWISAHQNQTDTANLCSDPISNETGTPCPSLCKCDCLDLNNGDTPFVNIDCSVKNLTVSPWKYSRIYSKNITSMTISLAGTGSEESSVILEDIVGGLDLSGNAFDRADWITDSFPDLRLLALADNHLKASPEPLLQNLTQLEKVTLGGNPWTCNCSTMGFRKWLLSKQGIVQDVTKIHCADGRLVKNLSEFDLCPVIFPILYVYVSIGVLVLLLCCACCVLAWGRWGVACRVWLWAHGVSFLKAGADSADDLKRFDAFLSYSHQDEAFVLGKVVPVLESRAPLVRLCLHYKDFVAGEYIHQNILDAVRTSKKTLVFLSRSFLESEWCLMEFRAAHMQGLKDRVNRVIVVKLDDPPPHSIDPAIKMYLKTTTYLTWGEKHFWNNLLYTLPTSTNANGAVGTKPLQLADLSDVPKH